MEMSSVLRVYANIESVAVTPGCCAGHRGGASGQVGENGAGQGVREEWVPYPKSDR